MAFRYSSIYIRSNETDITNIPANKPTDNNSNNQVDKCVRESLKDGFCPDKFDELMEKQTLSTYIDACRMLKGCGMPKPMDDLYGLMMASRRKRWEDT